jgi:hypothetical protein
MGAAGAFRAAFTTGRGAAFLAMGLDTGFVTTCRLAGAGLVARVRAGRVLDEADLTEAAFGRLGLLRTALLADGRVLLLAEWALPVGRGRALRVGAARRARFAGPDAGRPRRAAFRLAMYVLSPSLTGGREVT